MDKFGVPCPQCGSIRVVVDDHHSARPTVAEERKSRTPQLHRCACLDCRHTFHHDFSFGG